MTKFRSSTNTRYLKALFYETTLADKSTVVYTLKDQDHQGYPSLYRLFMEEGDPTEWEFANKHLDGWEHWQMLTACSWFKPYIDRWRQELEIKIRSQALKAIQEEAEKNNRNSYNANKLLLDGGWKPKEPAARRGRPTKQEVEKQAIIEAADKLRINKDYERMNKETIQ